MTNHFSFIPINSAHSIYLPDWKWMCNHCRQIVDSGIFSLSDHLTSCSPFLDKCKNKRLLDVEIRQVLIDMNIPNIGFIAMGLEIPTESERAQHGG